MQPPVERGGDFHLCNLDLNPKPHSPAQKEVAGKGAR